jgi:hypothetical protein
MGFKYDTTRHRNKNAPKRTSGFGMIAVFIVLGVSIALGAWLPTMIGLRDRVPFLANWNLLAVQVLTGVVAFIILQFIVVLVMGAIIPPRPKDEYEEDAKKAMSQYVESQMGKRPLGITLLGVLYTVFGLLGAAGCAALLIFPSMPALQIVRVVLAQLGLASTVQLIWGGVVSLLCLAAGLGLWSADPWGWWLGGLLTAYSGLESGAVLMGAVGLMQQPDTLAVGTPLVIRYGAQTFLAVMVFLYYFKRNVIEYVGLRRQSKLAALAILIPAAVIAFAGWQMALEFLKAR